MTAAFDAFDGLANATALLVGVLSVFAIGAAVLLLGAIVRRLR